jgi:hypothetical protein
MGERRIVRFSSQALKRAGGGGEAPGVLHGWRRPFFITAVETCGWWWLAARVFHHRHKTYAYLGDNCHHNV